VLGTVTGGLRTIETSRKVDGDDENRKEIHTSATLISLHPRMRGYAPEY
jgi:hypothetical protein